jgi:hypothetical protein
MALKPRWSKTIQRCTVKFWGDDNRSGGAPLRPASALESGAWFDGFILHFVQKALSLRFSDIN